MGPKRRYPTVFVGTEVSWFTSVVTLYLIASQNGPAGKVITLALPGDCEHPETKPSQDAVQHRLVWSPKAAGAAKYVYTRYPA